MERADFQQIDRTAAENFAAAAADAGIKRIIYLGGLGRGELSPHLASRQEVGTILRQGSVTVTEFRAAVIIGSGSLSFEMTRYLTEVLPVMVTPSWVQTRCQPIAIEDVLGYLADAPEIAAAADRIIEIGGPDVLTYEDLMQRYAAAAGLRRRVLIRVPLLSLSLSARWIGLVTPLSNTIASHLVESLEHEVTVTDTTANELMPRTNIGYEAAVRLAIEQTRGDDVPTRWARGSWRPADPLPSDPEHAYGTIFRDERALRSGVDPAAVARAFMRVGGANGYYAAGWAWTIRGFLDQLFGGAGLRRGRRSADTVSVGEPLDFWRVVRVEPGTALELKSEMRTPGDAWLGWRVEETAGGGSRLVQTAWFAPRGLLGRLYWFALLPFHTLIFPRMARGIVRAAENEAAQTTV